jgi:hypothetical protein
MCTESSFCPNWYGTRYKVLYSILSKVGHTNRILAAQLLSYGQVLEDQVLES